jgi:hypothetical protein
MAEGKSTGNIAYGGIVGDEIVFNVVDGKVTEMPSTTLKDIGFKERADLQKWIEDYPEIVERDLLVVTTEFNQWELRTQRVEDRLDVLFLDSDGALVVAELKRGEAPDTVDLQALKYAAYCSQLTVEDLVDAYARHHNLSREGALADVLDHAPSLRSSELRPVRVRLVAEAFRASVTTTVLWLRDVGLDIGCVEVSPRMHPDGGYIITARQLLPLPAAEDYLVKRRRREKAEEEHEASGRRRNTVTILLEANAIEPRTELRLNLDQFSPDDRTVIEPEVKDNPEAGVAEWTGLGLRKALRWRADGKTYSATGLVKHILVLNALDVHPLPGPRYWKVPDGRTLSHLANVLDEDLADEET